MSLIKKKKIVSFFFRQTQDQRKEESMQLWIGSRPRFERKGSFCNQDEWLRGIEEHERKSNTSEKQLVEMNSLKPFWIRCWKKSKKHVFNVAGVRVLAANLEPRGGGGTPRKIG